MGFLDRMVADLIADSTGLPVRRLVRRVGARNLLLLGGAAVAGGFAVQKLSQTGHQPTGTGVPPAAPPPPPVPVPLPPLPPIPTDDHVAPPSDDLPPGVAYSVVRTMVAASLADGDLAPAEKAMIQDHVADSGLADDQIQQIRRDLVVPPIPAELAEMTPAADDRVIIFRSALLVLLADADISAAEESWLARLGDALDIDPATRAEIRGDLARLSVPPTP